MSRPKPQPPLPDTGEISPAEEARLAEAVASVGKVVPFAPQEFLAPRLRTPLFAGFMVLALGTHAAGLGGHFLLGGREGDAGRLNNGLGMIVIEAEIIDGQEAAEKGGATDAAMPGNTDPLAMAALDLAASRPQTMAESAPPPVRMLDPDVLATDASAEMQVAAVVPPPPFQLDTSTPPMAESAERVVEPVTEPVQKLPDPEQAKVEPAVAQEASLASTAGDGGMAQTTVEMPGVGGKAGATPGEIRTYQARLGARIRSNKPSSRGKAGFVEVAFAIEADGRLRFVEVKRSSGNAFLEDRALAAIRKSSPFPKPPPLMSGKQLEFSVPFKFE
jgi:periplasmic protein TonB